MNKLIYFLDVVILFDMFPPLALVAPLPTPPIQGEGSIIPRSIRVEGLGWGERLYR